MSAPKTIDELYEECRDFEMVVTNDTALARALNRKREGPMVGRWAVTPRQLAINHAAMHVDEPLCSEAELIKRIAHSLGLPLAYSHQCVLRVRDALRCARSVRGLLTSDERRVHDVLLSLPSLEAVMMSFDHSVLPAPLGVIGDGLFDALDLRVLPPSYASVSAFKDAPFTLPSFFGADSHEEVVRYVCDHVTSDNQDDIAIVVDKGGAYHSSILSVLQQRGFTVNLAMQLNEHLMVRSLHGLISAALEYPRLRVSDVRPFFGIFNIDMPLKYDKYHVDAALPDPSPRYERLKELLSEIPNMTYGDVIWRISENAGTFPEELNDTIRTLGFYDTPVTRRSFEELSYCIMNFDIALQRPRRGVVLTDAHNSMYVDRPICIFVGLDAEWRRRLPSIPLNDTHEIQATHVNEFKILLTQGEASRAVVALRKNGEVVMPCQYFSLILEGPVEDFFHPTFDTYRVTVPLPSVDRMQAPIAAEATEWDGPFSQSSLNRFMECPKRFEYGRLVSTAEAPAMMKGRLIHEFAELYLSHPALVRERGDRYFASVLAEEYAKLVTDEQASLATSSFLMGIRMMRAYLDSLELGEPPRFEKRPKDNTIARRLGVDASTPYGEVRFTSSNHPVMGYIDLLLNNNHIVDYKTGARPKSTKRIMRELHAWLHRDRVDVQPILYLLALCEQVPNTELTFTYFHPYADMERAIEGEPPSAKNCVTVSYVPTTFHEFLADERSLDTYLDTKSNQAFVKKVGRETVMSFLKDHPPTLEDQFLAPHGDCPWIDEFISYIRLHNETKTVTDNARSFAQSIIKKRRGENTEVRLFRDDLDLFAAIVEKRHQQVGEFMATDFSAAPLDRKICDSCEFADHCIGRFW